MLRLIRTPAGAYGSSTPYNTPAVHIAETTGPLAATEGKKTLVLTDVENLTYSARDLGFRISYRLLAEKLQQISTSCSRHAFFSRDPGDEGRVRYFAARGWVPHPRDIEYVQTPRGRQRLANSDNFILFMAGLLASRSNAEVVVIASGDGHLVCDLAKFLATLPKRRSVITMSLAGSTSYRLDATKNESIASNIEIGLDCLRPIVGLRE